MKTLKLFLFITFVFYSFSLFSQLRFRNTQQTWKSGQGTIKKAEIVLKKVGHFTQYDIYAEYGGENIYFDYKPSDFVEISHFFTLPQNAIVIDSWLWVGDVIMKALILDRTAAFNIYEGIVSRNRDPSVLYKNNATEYEFRIFPLIYGETRKVKLSILVPNSINNDYLFSTMSLNFFKHSLAIPEIKFIIHDTQFDKEMTINNVIKFKEEVDANGKIYKTATLPKIEVGNSTSMVLNERVGNTFKELYISKKENNEGIYQVMLDQSDFINYSNIKGKKVLLCLNHDASSTNSNVSQAKNFLKSYIKSNLNVNDSVKIFYNKIDVVRHLDNWTDVKSLNLDQVVDELKPSNISSIAAVLKEAYSEMKLVKDGEIVLLTSGIDFGNPTAAQNLKNELLEDVESLSKTFILDYSTFNKHFVQHYYNNVYYSGAEILHKILTSNSKGTYEMLSKYNKTISFEDALLSLRDAQTLVESNSFSYYFKPSGGLCYDNYTIQNNGQILQIGRYIGDFPFKMEYSLIYAGDVILGEKVFDTSDAKEYESLKEFDQCYYGKKLLTLENLPFSQSNIETITELSIEHRILSLYTAFLALEPGMQEPCIDCEDETVFTDTEEEGDTDLQLKIYPNPCVNEFSISFKGLENNVEIGLYNIEGRQIKLIIFDKNDTELTIDMKDLPAGVYYIKYVYKGKAYNYKIVKVN